MQFDQGFSSIWKFCEQQNNLHPKSEGLRARLQLQNMKKPGPPKSKTSSKENKNHGSAMKLESNLILGNKFRSNVRISFLFLWPIFWLGHLFFWSWAVWVACIFLRLVVCQLLHLLLFSPILKAAFSPC